MTLVKGDVFIYLTDLKKTVFWSGSLENGFSQIFLLLNHSFPWFHAAFEALLLNTCNFAADSGMKRIEVQD